MKKTFVEILIETREYFQKYSKNPDDKGIIVFVKDENRAKYFGLSDYFVSASVSGPALVLNPIPR